MTKPDIRAAGAVVLRGREPEREVLVIHRPRYDDWSLPKGKLGRNETSPVCAVREVREETGVTSRLIRSLASHRYAVGGRSKQVDWWLAEPVGAVAVLGPRNPEEVDTVAWLPLDEAAALLTYAAERELLTAATTCEPTTPLLLLRHAKAIARKNWSGPDSERPLTDWGRRQTRALASFLAAFGVRRVVSSSALRCLQTVTTYALAHDVPLEGWHDLTEEQFEVAPQHAGEVLEDLANVTAGSCVPTVVCGHRPVFPAMLAGLGLPDRKFAIAESLVVSLRPDGRVAAHHPLSQRVGR